MFDAYTVKKVLPKLVIAAILIQLSWPLFTLLLLATNQIAWGLEGLLYAPFGGRDELAVSESLKSVAGTSEYLLILGGGAAWLAIGAPGVLALAIGIILALLTAFFVLSIRQVVIVILLVTAPIALVAWILPNTEKFWKLWWGTFSKALLMYPLIILIIAGGRIAAWLVGESGIDGAIGSVIVLFVFFAPFFLIGKTFSFAGGAIASVGGALSGRASGISGGFRKRSMAKQQEKWGSRADRAKAGDLFNGSRFIPGSSKVADSLNKVTSGVGTAGVGGAFGLNKKGQARVEMMRNARQAERMKQPGVQDLLFDDDVRLAVMQGNDRRAQAVLAEKYGNDTATISKAMAGARAIGFDSTSALAAFNFEAANKSRNFVDTTMADGTVKSASQIMNENVDRIAENTGVDAERLRQSYMYAAGTQGGRLDLRAESVDKVVGDKFDTRLMQQSTAPAWQRIASKNKELLMDDDADVRRRSAAQLIAMQDSLPGTSEGSRNAFIKEMEAMGIKYDGSEGSVEVQLAKRIAPPGASAEAIQGIAKEIRYVSSTYGSSTPEEVRNQNPNET